VGENRLLSLLRLGRPLLADGAMGTRLQEMGLPSGAPAELWNEERPEAVLEVHRSYVKAGSDIILSNTFGGNRRKLSRFGLGERAFDLVRRGAELAREAAGEGVAVLGSTGPVGELLEPLGTLSRKEAAEVYAEQARALAEGGADAVLFETFSDLEELKVAIEAALEAVDLPICCTMTFEPNGMTVMGVSVERFVSEVEGMGEGRVALIGANCSIGPREMEPIAERLCKVARLPVMVKPNAGQPRLVEGRAVYDATPEEFAESARRWLEAGARVIGGCCGTTAEHVRAMAEVVRDWSR